MYTIQDASKLLGLSRMTLYNKKTLLASKGYVQYKNDVLYITNEGINFLREEYIPTINNQKRRPKEQAKKDVKDIKDTSADLQKEVLEIQRKLYQEQIDFLKSQLEKAERKNNELMELLKSKDTIITQFSNRLLPTPKKKISLFKKRDAE